MSKQIDASPSEKKISDLYNRIKDNSFILQPDFQRKFVWSKKHKEEFIDTILKGLPFPEIFTAQTGIDIEKIETQEVIVDGQQRLSTIVQYIDELDEEKIFGNLVPRYQALDNHQKKEFLNYKVTLRDLGDISSDQIKEIFRRINLTKYALEEIEIHNAIYDGEFISTGKEILKEFTFEDFQFISESEISRMEDLQYILTIMATVENDGYFSGYKEIEKYVKEYNDEYPNKNSIKEKILNALNMIKAFNLEKDSIWLRKSSFFSLVCEIIFNGSTINDLKTKILKLEKNILESKNQNREKNKYSNFYFYIYSGTASRQARVVRSKIIKDEIFGK